MKPIKNIENLIQRLSSNDNSWQRTIYEATGVILTESLYLFSNCGCISLNIDFEYHYVSGVDTTEYCEVNSIEDIIAYIKEMESYSDFLIDVSYGNFTKSSLFWGIYERILLRHENHDEAGEQYWGLYSISKYEEHTELHMALIPCCSAEIWTDISTETTINDVLAELVSVINVEADNRDWLPVQKVFDVNYAVPNTYDELKAKCSKGEVFGWLA